MESDSRQTTAGSRDDNIVIITESHFEHIKNIDQTHAAQVKTPFRFSFNNSDVNGFSVAAK
jgi:hypothetical protein